LGADAAYYTAATAYLQYLLESEAVGKTLATNLMQAEIAYLNYRLDSSNAAHKADFIALMEQIKTDYATLTEEHKAYLADMYNYYVGIYEELTAAPAA
jgi:hypothetical protein